MKTEKESKDIQNNYRLDEIIGKGSFGKVYKGLDKKTGKVVAIKIVDMEESESEIEEIFSEIAFLGTCSSEYITRYFTSCVVAHKLWIVMEYMGGGSVQDILNLGPIAEIYCQIILRDSLKGLQYLHRYLKIHRDMKCGNILLSDYAQVKLADFGVAGQLTKTVDKRSTFVGTPFWMAPEVIKQCEYGTAVDIWSLGIAAIEMVDTKPPHYDGHPMKALFLITKEPPPTPKNVTISKSFRAFIALCLNKDPTARPDAYELLKNPFIKKAKKNHYMEPLIQRYKQYCQASNVENLNTDNIIEASGIEENQDNKWLFETVRIADRELVQNIVTQSGNLPDSQLYEKQIKSKSVEINLSPPYSKEPSPSDSVQNLQTLYKNSSNERIVQSEDIPFNTETPISVKSSYEIIESIIEQLRVKHIPCSKQITELQNIFNNNDPSDWVENLALSIKKYVPCKS